MSGELLTTIPGLVEMAFCPSSISINLLGGKRQQNGAQKTLKMETRKQLRVEWKAKYFVNLIDSLLGGEFNKRTGEQRGNIRFAISH
jgi:hypothetical protein